MQTKESNYYFFKKDTDNLYQIFNYPDENNELLLE